MKQRELNSNGNVTNVRVHAPRPSSTRHRSSVGNEKGRSENGTSKLFNASSGMFWFSLEDERSSSLIGPERSFPEHRVTRFQVLFWWNDLGPRMSCFILAKRVCHQRNMHAPAWCDLWKKRKIACASLFCPCCWSLPHFCPVMHSQPVNQ